MLTEAIGWPFEPGSSVGFLLDCALKGGLLLLTVGLLLCVRQNKYDWQVELRNIAFPAQDSFRVSPWKFCKSYTWR